MTAVEQIDTHQKALSINLDPTIFGSFAEIGAGQEVVRWFLRVGGASGTVAKSISAYDKEVSDRLYGAGTRYVSRQRLEAMLSQEWEQLTGLQPDRGATTRFFTFADTVSARNYSGTNECHGWIGLRFRHQPEGQTNDVILHVNLRDDSNLLQQEAVGVVGVNLIYAAFHHLGSPEEFLKGVSDELSLRRVEIDLADLSGPAFQDWDRQKLNAMLVTDGYAEAILFPVDGQLVPPTEVLYKKALVLAPVGFETAEELQGHLIQGTLQGLPKDEVDASKGALGLFCLSRAPLTQHPSPKAEQISRQAEGLRRLGSGVLVFRASELYAVSAYVSRYTKSRVHFAVGLGVVVFALKDRYNNLDGALLEALGRLFAQNVRFSVHPTPVAALERHFESMGVTGWKYTETNGMVYAENLEPAEPWCHLYRYLLRNNHVLSLR